MIKNYADHAANERTFLAWQRTGLSIAAFGFVVQRFNLFLAEFAQIMPAHPVAAGKLTGFLASFGRYDGFALALIGIAIVLAGAISFVRTAREIDRIEARTASGPRAELLLSGVLALLAVAFCGYLAVQ